MLSTRSCAASISQAPTSPRHTVWLVQPLFLLRDANSLSASTFAACIDACDATPGCIDISYAGEACYLKNKIETPLERDWVWTAKQVSPATSGTGITANLSCVDKKSDKATYTTPSGTTFQVQCGVDYAGGDMGATNTPTFGACIDTCASTPGCIDVSYAGSACYMKNKLEAAQDRDWVWTAKLVAADNSNGGGQSSTKLSCDGNASDGKIYKAKNDNFEITCGKDYAGGDLLGLGTASFEECIEACDAHVECINVAFVSGGCYLKKQQNPAVDSAAVWGAVRKPVTTPTLPSESEGPLSCEGNASNLVKYTSAKNGLYQVLCGVDYGGNDLTATSVSSFEACIAACDDNTECVTVR